MKNFLKFRCKVFMSDIFLFDFPDHCGRLSFSISLARPAVAGGLQILLTVYRAAVAEAFSIRSWLCRARRCGWLSGPRGFITTAVAGNLRLLMFFSVADDFLYPSPPLWTVSHDETIDRRLRCGRCHDGSGPPLRRFPSSKLPI